ncbi:MAG: hypothetical protein DRP09_17755 [Candidatus Thorarchaeota archaeon]|nr:MAG: hypothetical protein DRP09_17755 [Candidatus Thorarchaeota archaeon]
MKIKQLGNNGGLGDPTKTNSSFLIDLHDDHSEYLLFDIGYNVMARLVEEELNDPHFEIAKIKYLVVSHKHDDHCGNLETLIYWNHFKNNVQMDIYVACKDLAKTVKDTRKIVDNFKVIKAKTYESLTVIPKKPNFDRPTTYIRDIEVYFNKGFHGAKRAIGMYIVDNTENSFYISGDTKAHKSVETASSQLLKEYLPADLIFHDFSNWDDESKNVHACATDFEREYSEEFKSKVIKYHTGSNDFNHDWQG